MTVHLYCGQLPLLWGSQTPVPIVKVIYQMWLRSEQLKSSVFTQKEGSLLPEMHVAPLASV